VVKLLIISDVHGNWVALQAVLRTERRVDNILCLGDLVDYGPEPVECVKWAMKNAGYAWLVQGNHDRAVATGEDPRCSLPYRHLARVTQEFSIRALNRRMRTFLGALKPQFSFKIGGADCVACHAAPSDPLYRYLRTNDTDRLQAELNIAGKPDFLFFGHTHWPMDRKLNHTRILNPGSVGQPKDGHPTAAYALWQDGEIFLRRATYNIEEAVKAFGKTSLESNDIVALAHVLRTGGGLPVQSRLRMA
jgi:putative phosphoesterase